MELDLSSCHHRRHHLHDLVIVNGSNIKIYWIVKCRKKKHASRKDICIRDIRQVRTTTSYDLLIFDSRLLWQTVSSAADKSTATQIVRSGGFLWLHPIAISVVICGRAEVVE